jgi:hypothetical protein
LPSPARLIFAPPWRHRNAKARLRYREKAETP